MLPALLGLDGRDQGQRRLQLAVQQAQLLLSRRTLAFSRQPRSPLPPQLGYERLLPGRASRGLAVSQPALRRSGTHIWHHAGSS